MDRIQLERDLIDPGSPRFDQSRKFRRQRAYFADAGTDTNGLADAHAGTGSHTDAFTNTRKQSVNGGRES